MHYFYFKNKKKFNRYKNLDSKKNIEKNFLSYFIAFLVVFYTHIAFFFCPHTKWLKLWNTAWETVTINIHILTKIHTFKKKTIKKNILTCNQKDILISLLVIYHFLSSSPQFVLDVCNPLSSKSHTPLGLSNPPLYQPPSSRRSPGVVNFDLTWPKVSHHQVNTVFWV